MVNVGGEKLLSTQSHLFLQIMALSIRSINLRNATAKVLLRIAIFHSKGKSFLPWMFSRMCYINGNYWMMLQTKMSEHKACTCL